MVRETVSRCREMLYQVLRGSRKRGTAVCLANLRYPARSRGPEGRREPSFLAVPSPPCLHSARQTLSGVRNSLGSSALGTVARRQLAF